MIKSTDKVNIVRDGIVYAADGVTPLNAVFVNGVLCDEYTEMDVDK